MKKILKIRNKNKEEIKTLIDAAWEPERVAVIHC